jgi:hypothetical protein
MDDNSMDCERANVVRIDPTMTSDDKNFELVFINTSGEPFVVVVVVIL